MLRSLRKATPQAPATPLKAKRLSTFQEFESSTSDAWDAGEDEDELLAMAAESLHSEVVMETAHRVLRDHSRRQEQRQPQDGPQPPAEPPPVPGGDPRLAKSVSESHTPCPAGGMGTLEGSGPSSPAAGAPPLRAGGPRPPSLCPLSRVAGPVAVTAGRERPQ